MDKIPFEDGKKLKNATVTIDGQEYEVNPAQYSGTTPMSGFNLNKMQDNIDNAKAEKSELYYIAGETDIITRINTAGFITTSSTSVRFMTPLNKDATGLNIRIKSGTIWIRTVDSTYAVEGKSILENNTVRIINNGKSICIQLTYSPALSMKNNTPVGIDVEALSLEFY